uniref:CCDC81 HU domain-containing protein n=1 Tax=Rhizochromulina marina TaxID=1034831 RepID=A0A7S2WUV3_9STRA|mmetsp:Transcript_714/g.2281  ORF Transcript_714/g.2281 Transcript_714/m.2281 type:complete len:520 (+) Transcript_714:67-1626(+)
MYNARALFKDASQFGSPVAESERLWKAFGSYVDETLRMGKGLKIPKLGFFTSIRSSHRDAAPGIKGRVFSPARSFCRSYGVTARKTGKFLFSPCLEFNMSKLATKAKMDKDMARITLEVLIRTLGQAVAMGQNCRVLIDTVGTLIIQQREMSFRFQGYPEFMPIPAPPKWGVRSTAELLESVGLQSGDADGRTSSPFPEEARAGALIKEAEVHTAGTLMQSSRGRGHAASVSTLSLDSGPVDALDTMTQRLQGPNQVEDMEQRHPSSSQPRSGRASDQSLGQTAATLATSSRTRARPLTMGGFMERSRREPSSDTIPIFPKLLSTQGPNTRPGAGANSVTINLAYERLENQLQREKELEKKQQAEIQQRLDRSSKIQAERRQRERSRQDELNQFLRTQAEQHRVLREQQRQAERFQAPEPEKAYPVEKGLNMAEERQLKQSLRDFLDQQVRAKKELEAISKAREMERDRFLLQCLEDEASSEATEKIKQRQVEQKALAAEWAKQTALSKKGQSLFSKLV